MVILKQKKLLLAIVLFSVLYFTIPHFSHADGLVPCGGPNEQPCNVEHIFILVARVTNWLVSVAGIYAAFKIIQAGFGLTYAMGDEEAITTHKKQITNAILGLGLVMISFIVINTVINFILGPGLIGNENVKCKIDLTNPLNYLYPNQFDPSKCTYISK